MSTLEDQLKALDKARSVGVITDDEYATRRAAVIDVFGATPAAVVYPSYEYHAVSVMQLEGVKKELAKRAADGWRLQQAYKDETGIIKDRHVLIFERERRS